MPLYNSGLPGDMDHDRENLFDSFFADNEAKPERGSFFRRLINKIHSPKKANSPDQLPPCLPDGGSLSFDKAPSPAVPFKKHTPVYEDDPPTALISSSHTLQAALVPDDKRLPCIDLTERPVVIGKHKHLCDLVIERPVISRMHAKIYPENGDWYIRDLNSKNGTFLNGVILTGDAGKKLKIGDKICFADVFYNFDFAGKKP